MKKAFLLFLLICFTTTWVFSQDTLSYLISGSIYQDKNLNGKKDKREKGLAGIPVSNGVEIVHTNKKGKYSLSVRKGQSVFPIVPAQYAMVAQKNGSAVNNAAFYYINPSRPFQDTMIHFGLKKIDQKNQFTIGAIGDVQTGNSKELEYAGRSIFPEILNRKDIDFHIFLGDLFNNDLTLIPQMNRLLNNVPVPVWVLPGNHDRNTDNPAHMDDLFNQAFGAGTYAFNYGKVHFLVVNNVYATGTHSYEGRYSDAQLEFLKQDLETITDDKLIVISQHIPMAYTKNNEAVFNLLKRFEKVLILSGHTHRVGRVFYENGRIQELIAGAASGMWWTGEKDVFGVPQALMQCGSPRNYFTIQFSDNRYKIGFKAIGYDSDYQMDITQDSAYIITNVFGASDSTSVRISVNNGPFYEMTHTAMIAPNVAQIIQKNNKKIFPTPENRINPLRKQSSPHIWKIDRSTLSGDPIFKIHIRASDAYGFAAEQIIFPVED